MNAMHIAFVALDYMLAGLAIASSVYLSHYYAPIGGELPRSMRVQLLKLIRVDPWTAGAVWLSLRAAVALALMASGLMYASVVMTLVGLIETPMIIRAIYKLKHQFTHV